MTAEHVEETLKNIISNFVVSAVPACIRIEKPKQNSQHFADIIFRCVFFNENFLISNEISLKCVHHSNWQEVGFRWRLCIKQPRSHYFNQWRQSSMTSYAIPKPQWVKSPLHLILLKIVWKISPHKKLIFPEIFQVSLQLWSSNQPTSPISRTKPAREQQLGISH